MKATPDAFNRNLLLGFGASLLLLIISAVASFISIQNLLYSNQMANKAKDANLKLEEALSYLKDAETSQRGYLLTANPVFLEPYAGKLDSIMVLLKDVQELTRGNTQQERNMARLKNLVNQRWASLASLINDKQNGKTVSPEYLLKGKIWMDEAQALVDSMQKNELEVLAQRTERFNRFSAFTPILIIVTTLIAIVSTLLFFNRVRSDFAQKSRLQQELQEKEAVLARRISITGKVAAEIANGSYDVRVDVEEGDELGSLAADLNRMAASLEDAFGKLREKEWFLAGQALFNEIMLGQKSIEIMTLELLRSVGSYVHSEMGALYLLNETGEALSRVATIGLKPGAGLDNLALGEGLAGRCAAEAITLHLTADEQETYLFETVAGTLKPVSLIAVPLTYQGRVNGVLELAGLQPFDAGVQNLLEDAGRTIGIALNSLQNNIRLQELLQQTQAQSEELQAQHTELENINTELEAQTNKLLASEEELRVQQEELMEANAVLEERSRMLEEKNEEIAQRNREVQLKADELARATRYKSEFLANMSHELRTPLNSILLLSRLLEENNDGSLSQEQTEYARVIQTSGKGLLALIDEVLDLSKIEAGKMELETHTVVVDEVLKDLQGLFVPLAREKGLAFHIEAAEAPGTILTDQQRLEQILKNLVSNAVKFTKEGSVTLTVSSEDANIRFAVQDTGIGISPAHMEGIFEAFRQADGTTRRRFGGTGLGLSISKELARLLGGDIVASSEEGKGSLFVLTIPKILETSAAPTVSEQAPLPALLPAAPEPAPLPQPGEAASVPAEAFPPKSLLIIEDDAPFAAALKQFIKEKGYEVLVAPDGEAGLSMLQEHRPDGILLDIMLPGKDGWEVLDELKKNPSNRSIPVHVMSSLNARRESMERGANGFISKPLAFEQMGDVIKSLEALRVRGEGGKALIIEDNLRHAKALAGFLAEHRITAAVASKEAEALAFLQNNSYDCVILETFTHKLELMQVLRQARGAGLDKLNILIFTGQHLNSGYAQNLKQYADSIVLKTAHSYQRVLDEVSLFIHNLENPARKKQKKRHQSSMDVLRGKRLLIADDDVRNIFSLTKLLEQHGISVKAATDGREAVEQMLQSEQVDAILMDIMMPEMDGFEAIRRIRKLPGCAELPIIAITAKAMKGDKEKCLQAGASDYISKPVDVDQLLSLLRVWLYERGL